MEHFLGLITYILDARYLSEKFSNIGRFSNFIYNPLLKAKRLCCPKR
jgi:hypothetical protein